MLVFVVLNSVDLVSQIQCQLLCNKFYKKESPLEETCYFYSVKNPDARFGFSSIAQFSYSIHIICMIVYVFVILAFDIIYILITCVLVKKDKSTIWKIYKKSRSIFRLYFGLLTLFLAYRAVVFYFIYFTDYTHLFEKGNKRTWYDFLLHLVYYIPEVVMAVTIIKFSIENKNQDNSMRASFKAVDRKIHADFKPEDSNTAVWN